jgi:hypothetical protein
MVAAGAHIWNPGEDGGSLATQEDEQLEAVKLCVQQGNDIFGDTPLHGAAYRGANSIIEFLIKSGALDAKDSRGWTPLAIAKWNQVRLLLQSSTRNRGSARKLHEEGRSADNEPNRRQHRMPRLPRHPPRIGPRSHRANQKTGSRVREATAINTRSAGPLIESTIS